MSVAQPLAPWPRAWLFTPADDARRLERALSSGAGAVIADLEDAVAPADKSLARQNALSFLADVGEDGGPARIVRINDPRTDTGREDIERVAALGPTTMMVPKSSLAALEAARVAHSPVVALLETAEGIAHAEQIAVREEVVALAIGTVDLAAELELGDLGGLELVYARSRLVLAAALGGVPAIDGVYVSVADEDGLRLEARRARALGFAAKLCIHPAQLGIVRDAFTPSAQELDHARSVVAAYERSLADGRGATLAGEEMVDLATVRRARLTLERAEQG
jgi:citrate lyase subunit beta/citryl-CoA lyase